MVVNGLILAEDGQKMSKRLKNYPDPELILGRIGADALRVYLINSPAVRAEPLRFSEAGLEEVVRTVVLPYWNAVSFFTTYAAVDLYDPRTWTAPAIARRPELDRWMLSTLQTLIGQVNHEMEHYRLYAVVPRLCGFIEDLTNWYVRRSRARIWKNADRDDQAAAYATLHQVLTTFARVLAPFMPFLTEEVHQRLALSVDPGLPASVHWCDYPQSDPSLIDEALERRMSIVRRIVALGRKQREGSKLKVRQPLALLTVVSRDGKVLAAAEGAQGLILNELNCKRLATSSDEGAVCTIQLKPNFEKLRKRAGPKLKEIGRALASWGPDQVARLEAGEELQLAGIGMRLEDVLLMRTPLAGSEVASDGEITLACSTPGSRPSWPARAWRGSSSASSSRPAGAGTSPSRTASASPAPARMRSCSPACVSMPMASARRCWRSISPWKQAAPTSPFRDGCRPSSMAGRCTSGSTASDPRSDQRLLSCCMA